jgi:AcrR family transcriptional regulator
MAVRLGSRAEGDGVTSQPARRRNRRGTETRVKIEEAAGGLFTAQGYHGTSMQEIADAAGVHVQTIYLAYRTKAELLRAAASRPVAEGEDPSVPPPERRWVREIVATDDPQEKLRLYLRHLRHVTQGWGPFQQAMRAAADEPEVAEKLAAMEYGRYQGPLNLWPAIADSGGFRDGIDAARAADLTYAIASPDTFRQLLDRGWTADEAEAGILEALVRLLLRD